MTSAFTTQTTGTETTRSNWVFDPVHSAVEFSAKHMMVTTVRGRFDVVDVNLDLDENDLTNSSVEATIKADSLETNDPNRNKHIHSADFLEVEKYPTITFKSKRVERKGEDHYRVIGDLTIRDVTREVELDTTLEGRGVNPWGKEIVAFEAKTSINRKDFGLKWNVALETGGVLVGETVKIELQVQAYKES
ncbi:MAG: YceI family protein [Chloroflexia bacterium]